MEKKKIEPIQLDIELAELMLKPGYYVLLGDFITEFKKLRLETNFDTYHNDAGFIYTRHKVLYYFKEEAFYKEAVFYYGHQKISSINNVMFEYKYHHFMGDLQDITLEKLFSCDDFFDNFVRFYEYLKDIEKEDQNNILNARQIFVHISSFKECPIKKFILDPSYPMQEYHRGNMYCYTKESKSSIKPYTRFDFTDGNICVDENKPDCLSYVSNRANFVIKNIYAKPIGKLDFENNTGDYEEIVEFPECIYFNNLTFDVLSLPKSNTVDDTLYKIFPALSFQISINKQLASINKSLDQLSKEKENLKKVIGFYNREDLSEKKKEVFAKKIQSIAFSHTESLKEASDFVDMDILKLLLDKK